MERATEARNRGEVVRDSENFVTIEMIGPEKFVLRTVSRTAP